MIAGSTAFSVLMAIVVGRCRAGEGSADHNSVLGYFFSMVGAFYSFLLAFVVVNTWASLNDAQTNVFEEAGNLPGLYYDASVFPDEHRIPVQRAAKDYAEKVIDQEWPCLARTMDHPFQGGVPGAAERIPGRTQPDEPVTVRSSR